MAISSKRWTIIEMRTPSRTDSAPSTRGVSGRKSSKSMYISDLVDYITRVLAILHGDEHVNDAKSQRHCTHGAKPCVPKQLRKLLRRRECFNRCRQVGIRARMLRHQPADEGQYVPEVPQVEITERRR